MIWLTKEQKEQGFWVAQYVDGIFVMACIMAPNGEKVWGSDEVIEVVQ